MVQSAYLSGKLLYSGRVQLYLSVGNATHPSIISKLSILSQGSHNMWVKALGLSQPLDLLLIVLGN